MPALSVSQISQITTAAAYDLRITSAPSQVDHTEDGSQWVDAGETVKVIPSDAEPLEDEYRAVTVYVFNPQKLGEQLMLQIGARILLLPDDWQEKLGED